MANQNARIDSNFKKTLTGVTDDVNAEIRRLLIDPATGRLKVSASSIDIPASVVASHIQVDRFTTTAGAQTFTATKSAVEATILLIINGQPLTPTDDWTFVAPNQMTTTSSDYPESLVAIWIYIY